MFNGNCCTGKGERRGPRMIGHILGGIGLAVVFALIFSIFVQMLWNWLMPPLFHLGTIEWVQAFGLMLLARLLFGSMGHHGRNHHDVRRGRHGHHHWNWRGCGGEKEDAANGDIENWQHYDAWWNAEGREAFRKYAGSRESGREDCASK